MPSNSLLDSTSDDFISLSTWLCFALGQSEDSLVGHQRPLITLTACVQCFDSDVKTDASEAYSETYEVQRTHLVAVVVDRQI